MKQLSDETRALLQQRYSALRTDVIYDMAAIADGFELRFPADMTTPADIQAMGELHRALLALSYGLPAPEGE